MMKIAIITTKFLEDFVRNVMRKLDFQHKNNIDIEIFIYKDFFNIGDLYLDIEDKFDGFMVSGPVPKQAIIKKAVNINKPLVDFGTDLQSYYEMFFKLIYKYNTLDLSRAYFDLMDLADDSKDMSYYLANGTFGDLMHNLNEIVIQKSLNEIAQLEKDIAKKHIKLWKEGKIDFSTTRFSSIVPQLQQSGVNYHFVYPNINLLQSSFNELLKDIDIHKMKINQSAVIYITLKQKEYDDSLTEKIYNLLNNFKKEILTDLIIKKNDNAFEIFTNHNTIKSITENFTVCPIKNLIENSLKIKVSVGYGIGKNINQAVSNSIIANRESNNNSDNCSFVITENSEIIGPLSYNKILTIDNIVTPYIKHLSKKMKLSTLTIQKLLSVMDTLNTDEISPSELASCLNVTVRTANRYLSTLLRYGKAEILYEKQNSSKGRPERVYKLLINEDK